jgi:hypothetical protein
MEISELNNLSISNKSKNPICHPALIKTLDSRSEVLRAHTITT